MLLILHTELTGLNFQQSEIKASCRQPLWCVRISWNARVFIFCQVSVPSMPHRGHSVWSLNVSSSGNDSMDPKLLTNFIKDTSQNRWYLVYNLESAVSEEEQELSSEPAPFYYSCKLLSWVKRLMLRTCMHPLFFKSPFPNGFWPFTKQTDSKRQRKMLQVVTDPWAEAAHYEAGFMRRGCTFILFHWGKKKREREKEISRKKSSALHWQNWTTYHSLLRFVLCPGLCDSLTAGICKWEQFLGRTCGRVRAPEVSLNRLKVWIFFAE